MRASIHPERPVTGCFRSDRDLSRYIGWNTRINTESAHEFKLVVCRINGANVSLRHRRSPRKDAQRRRTRRCVKVADTASDVEGRRGAAIICKTYH